MISATIHAQTRLRQRGIPRRIIELLFSFGRSHHDHHGAELIYFDSKARERLQSMIDQESLGRYSRHLDCYAVVTLDGTILGSEQESVKALDFRGFRDSDAIGQTR